MSSDNPHTPKREYSPCPPPKKSIGAGVFGVKQNASEMSTDQFGSPSSAFGFDTKKKNSLFRKNPTAQPQPQSTNILGQKSASTTSGLLGSTDTAPFSPMSPGRPRTMEEHEVEIINNEKEICLMELRRLDSNLLKDIHVCSSFADLNEGESKNIKEALSSIKCRQERWERALLYYTHSLLVENSKLRQEVKSLQNLAGNHSTPRRLMERLVSRRSKLEISDYRYQALIEKNLKLRRCNDYLKETIKNNSPKAADKYFQIKERESKNIKEELFSIKCRQETWERVFLSAACSHLVENSKLKAEVKSLQKQHAANHSTPRTIMERLFSHRRVKKPNFKSLIKVESREEELQKEAKKEAEEGHRDLSKDEVEEKAEGRRAS